MMEREIPIEEGREFLERIDQAKKEMSKEDRNKLFDNIFGKEPLSFDNCDPKEFGMILDEVCKGMFATPLSFDNEDSIKKYFDILKKFGITVSWNNQLTSNEVIGILQDTYNDVLSEYKDFDVNCHVNGSLSKEESCIKSFLERRVQRKEIDREENK